MDKGSIKAEPKVDPPARSDIEELTKRANIAEIVELLDDTRQDKEWLIKQISEQGLRIQVDIGMNPVSILKMCPTGFVTNLLVLLRNLKQDVVSSSPLTKTYHWFFTDIVASSDPLITTEEQLRKIVELYRMIRQTEIFRKESTDSMMILPTGDGVAIGFEHNPEKPLILAFQLHDAIIRYNLNKTMEDEKIYVRIGLDTGPVYLLEDLRGKQNVWGPGIITARRVMDLAKSMNILSSTNIASSIRDLKPEYRDYFHPVGDYPIKHGENITIHNIYGGGKGNPEFPEPGGINETTFFFNRIEVTLQVRDVNTMLTHHSWLWEFVNISKKTLNNLFCYLEGDEPRDFNDLNVMVTDQNNNRLPIPAVHKNKPYRKEFFVMLNTPLLPYKTTMLKIEYDWEETDRQYFYKIDSECREFRFRLMVPRELSIEHKVLQVDDYNQFALPKTSPEIRSLNDTKEMIWSAQDLHAKEKYRFSW